MHQYLRAIGYTGLKKRDLDKLLYDIQNNPDHKKAAIDTQGNEFVEIRKDVNDDIGIAIRGTYSDSGKFKLDYYFPYCRGQQVSTNVPVEVVRESARESYLGLCDDLRLGIDLIFHVQDMLSILESDQRNQSMVDFGGVALGALSTDGKILMPLYSSRKQVENIERYSKKHYDLLTAAMEGDEEAYEKLAMDDMDVYSMISERMEQEDLYSIITSYFMPNGIESDKYSILGEIIECNKRINYITAEKLHVLKIKCNDIVFDMVINSRDLFGEPSVGRRFKGDIWMQGTVCCR